MVFFFGNYQLKDNFKIAVFIIIVQMNAKVLTFK
tara:strand:- start:2470 stop:2571 length:102 start_codon:yes stop_codon:yes gene_type:complete